MGNPHLFTPSGQSAWVKVLPRAIEAANVAEYFKKSLLFMTFLLLCLIRTRFGVSQIYEKLSCMSRKMTSDD
jgi:hypothetical protein